MEFEFQRTYRPINQFIAPFLRFILCSVSKLVWIHCLLWLGYSPIPQNIVFIAWYPKSHRKSWKKEWQKFFLTPLQLEKAFCMKNWNIKNPKTSQAKLFIILKKLFLTKTEIQILSETQISRDVTLRHLSITLVTKLKWKMLKRGLVSPQPKGMRLVLSFCGLSRHFFRDSFNHGKKVW